MAGAAFVETEAGAARAVSASGSSAQIAAVRQAVKRRGEAKCKTRPGFSPTAGGALPEHEAVLQKIYAAVCAALLSVQAQPGGSADESVRIAWHLAAGKRFEETQEVKHLIAFELNKMLRGLAGSRANDTIILEERRRTLAVASTPSNVEETEVKVRRYGGDDPKDKSVKQRTETFSGTMEPDGKRAPAPPAMEDAGDGALYQLPEGDVSPGQMWMVTHQVLVDRELGQGPMSYTEKLLRVDEREGHKIAVIQVDGTGRLDVAKDLQAKGFKTATMTLHGTAEFDVTAGLPGVQHYEGRVQWNTRIMFTHIGLIFTDTYDAQPWTAKESK